MTKLELFFRNSKKFLANYVHRRGITFTVTVLVAASVCAQQTVKGKIYEENSKTPLTGATIKFKGQKGGTVSDLDGNFQIEVTTLPATLSVVSVGFKAQEVDIYEISDSLSVYLAEDNNRLSTVVVVGYGTQKRSELTGSIASIPLPQIKESSQSTFVNSLQGLASGIQVTQNSGDPGGASTVRIRGGNSITGSNEPLYVIDGFPYTYDISQSDAGAIASSGKVSPLSNIDPHDIESIDVLKDASATAIYGSRGANGVIIVTTKNGKIGKGKVSYDGSIGIQEISHKIDLLDGKEWGIYKNDARASTGKTPLFSTTQLDSLGQHGTDWQAAALRRAPIQSHHVNISGGAENTLGLENVKYSLSLGSYNQQGIIIGSDFGRFTGNLRVDAKVNDKLNFGVSLIGSNSKTNIAPTSMITSTLYIPPTVSIIDPKTGKYTFVSPYESAVANPIASLNQATNQSITNSLISNAFAEYSLIPDLRLKVLVGANILDNKQNSYTPLALFEGSATKGNAAVGARFSNSFLNENTLSYNKIIAKSHNLGFLLGFTQQESVTEGVVASSQGFANDLTSYNDLFGGSSLVKPTSSYSKWSLLSYLGRATYNYKEKYFLTGSFRSDGSSRLASKNKYAYFPSAAIAWQVSKESFLQDIKNATKLSNLKLRLSAGKTGNQEIPLYQSLALLGSFAYPNGGGGTITGYAPIQAQNPELKWETTTQYDGGLDIGFFKERIRLSVDAYYKLTNDLLIQTPIPLTSGYSSVLKNVGSVENKGIEITLNTENIKGAFNWTTDVTFSLNRNKVLSLYSGVDNILVPSEIQTGNAIIVGQPLGAFWGYKTDGLYQNASDIPATPLLANTKVGDVKYVDVNGDGKITQAGDMTTIGNAQPKFIFGFTNNFSYANFDLSVFIQGSYGNQVYSYILQQLQVPTGYQNLIGAAADHYTAANPNATIQRPNELITTNPVSDLYVYDASYIRIKSLTLGFNVPKNKIAKLGIDKIRIYASAQNLLTVTKYPGYDPEVNSYPTNSSRQGVDVGAYPSAKSYNLGLSITF